MPDIDREKFAFAVAGRLESLHLSYSAAQSKFTGITKGLLSRVKNGHPVSAENMLTVCKHLALNPFDYLDVQAPNIRSQFGMSHKDKNQINQRVSVDASHETMKNRDFA